MKVVSSQGSVVREKEIRIKLSPIPYLLAPILRKSQEAFPKMLGICLCKFRSNYLHGGAR